MSIAPAKTTTASRDSSVVHGGMAKAIPQTTAKVTKTIVTKQAPVSLASSASASAQQNTAGTRDPQASITRRIISKRSIGEAVNLNNASPPMVSPLTSTRQARSTSVVTSPVIRSRSYSPTSRRVQPDPIGLPVRISGHTSQQCATCVSSGTASEEMRRSPEPRILKTTTTIGQVSPKRASERRPVSPSTSTLPASTVSWRYTTQPQPQVPSESSRSILRSISPHVECRAVYMQEGRVWKFSVGSESSVNDAISSATEQVLQHLQDSGMGHGDKLRISAMPSVNDNTTVGEWAHRNLDQPPMIVISNPAVDEPLVEERGNTSDVAQDMRRMMEEQTRLLIALQKQLTEQSAIILNQASFIQDLQAKDNAQTKLLNESIQNIKDDLANIKGQILGIEEILTHAGDENQRTKGL